MQIGISLAISRLRGRGGFSPSLLFSAGEQGVWYDPDDISTLFQDTGATSPVTAAGQSVARINDKSGRGNNATQSITAARPIYQVTPDRLTIDSIDDRLIVTVPTGGFNGTMVLATPEGTAAYGVNIPAGNFDIGGVGGLYFPGTAIVGQVIRNGAMTQVQIDQTIQWLRERGGGPNYGGVTNFTNYWRNQNRLTSFPVVDTSAGTSFIAAWQNCTSLTSFPLLNVSNGTNFLGAWRACSSLTSFPLLDVSNGTNFLEAWFGCSGLTSFPLLDVSSGASFQGAWQNCTSLTSFPLLNVSNGTNFLGAWRACSSLTSFPLLDVSSGTNFQSAWQNCSSLTSFPLLNVSNGTNFSFAWQNCTSLTTFPANFFDGCAATNFTNAFVGTALNQTSIDNILVSINSNGTSNGTFNQSGGSAPSVATGRPAIDALRARGWTVTVTGGY